MTPPCHNRAEFTDPNAGWERVGSRLIVKSIPTAKAWTPPAIVAIDKPVYRYRHPWFTDRCTVHDKADIGPGQTYAEFHKWDCAGCRWHPTEAK